MASYKNYVIDCIPGTCPSSKIGASFPLIDTPITPSSISTNHDSLLPPPMCGVILDPSMGGAMHVYPAGVTPYPPRSPTQHFYFQMNSISNPWTRFSLSIELSGALQLASCLSCHRVAIVHMENRPSLIVEVSISDLVAILPASYYPT